VDQLGQLEDMQALVQVNKAEKLAKKKGGHGVRPRNLYAIERSRLLPSTAR
jgi:hypothetical protein